MRNCQYTGSRAVKFAKHHVGKVFFEAVNNAQSETNLVCAIHCRVVQYTEKKVHTARYTCMEVCFITACTLAAVLCTRQSVQSAEIDEVSNIVVRISLEGGGTDEN